MLKYMSIAALLVLLSISSCKKQPIKNIILTKNGSKQAEKNDIFSPISELEAKKFAHSSVKESLHCQRLKNAKNINSTNTRFQKMHSIVELNEAKLSDVPIPLNSKPLQEYVEQCPTDIADKKIILGYICDMPDLDVIIFYNNQMERFGWEKIAFFSGIETLIIFKKPSRFCSISIRRYSCLPYNKQEYLKIVICTQF